MRRQKVVDILKQHARRITNHRVVLMEFLMDCPKALMFSEIEEQLSVPIDRVTVYRTLQTFEDVGLVVKMVDRNGVCRYMFNHENHNDIGTHPHLRCKSCDKVICLPRLPQEYLERLEKYEIDDLYFLMEGLCPDCLITEAKFA